MIYFFLLAIGVTAILTFVIRKIALYFGVVDTPDGKRKLHGRAIPLLGGLAIFIGFWSIVFYNIYIGKFFVLDRYVNQLWGAFWGSLLIMIVGIIDDKRSLSVWVRFLVSILVIMLVIISGLGLEKITNPFGGIINLHSLKITFPVMVTLGQVIVFLWLLGMMYTTKVLDGLDGLATGIAAIGGIMIFFLTQTKKFYQPEVGFLALVFAGVCIGFLFFNFHPAKIFLGETGSLFIGFILGILAVISGGKIATTLLVMAVPIVDLLRVLYLRATQHKKIFQGDREHLHFRLVDSGFKEQTAVLFLYILAFVFGLTTFFLQSKFKLVVLLFLGVGMVFLSSKLDKIKKNNI